MLKCTIQWNPSWLFHEIFEFWKRFIIIIHKSCVICTFFTIYDFGTQASSKIQNSPTIEMKMVTINPQHSMLNAFGFCRQNHQIIKNLLKIFCWFNTMSFSCSTNFCNTIFSIVDLSNSFASYLVKHIVLWWEHHFLWKGRRVLLFSSP